MNNSLQLSATQLNSDQLMSETEATSYAGVSLTTLLRFADAGYLRVFEADTPGQKQFLQSEVAKLFGLSQPMNKDLTEQTSGTTQKDSTVAKTNEIQQTTNASQNLSIANSDSTETVTELKEILSDDENLASYLSADALNEEKKISSSKKVKKTEKPEPQVASIPTIETPHSTETLVIGPKMSSTEKELQSKLSATEKERQRFEQLITLQEQLLQLKDKQIGDLQGQISWLRERIEKLEEKGHRDQILLLSETQTIRSIIATTQKKSAVRSTLEWLGFVKDKENTEAEIAIEYNKK